MACPFPEVAENEDSIQQIFCHSWRMKVLSLLFLERRRRSVLGLCLLTVVGLLAARGPSLLAADDALHYLPAGQPDAVAILPPPPLTGSPEQAADMATVVAVHGACTTNEAIAAFAEKKFDVFNFIPAVGPFFTAANLPKTTAFFARVQADAAAVTDTAKDIWKRPRPFVVDPSLASGRLEKSFSYPSGHSTESMVLALVLADLLPDKQDAILATARAIGWHRIQIARHYPTDIYAGRVFAKAIFNEMKASADYQKDFAEARAEILAVQQAAKN
jgi:acid phosphatase (class A)